MATQFDPVRFRTIDQTYKWAGLFLDRIATCFGADWLVKRLSKWSWAMSTAFTGVGCAESVQIPVLACSTESLSMS